MGRTILVGCAALAACLWIGSSVLFAYFHDGHLPRTSQPAIGRVYVSNDHGRIAFLTRDENYLFNALQVSAFIVFGLGFAADRRWKAHPQTDKTSISDLRQQNIVDPADYRAARASYEGRRPSDEKDPV
jgi:hypothetical protein